MRKGFALSLVIIFMGLLFVMVLLTLTIVANQDKTTNGYFDKIQAFYAAQAGQEFAKSMVSHNPNWYTDLKYTGNNKNTWLKTKAIGYKANLQRSNFKIIREKGENTLYSIGARGKAIVLLKLDFIAFPFQAKKWEEF